MGGGTHLVSPEAVPVVSAYPTQTVTSNKEAADNYDGIADSELICLNRRGNGFAASRCADGAVIRSHRPCEAHSATHHIPTRSRMVLVTQLCCGKLGSRDKHHRGCFTPADEYEVINNCKELEGELWRLWGQRPEVMSLPLNQPG
jgi:hypothetical protein